MPQRQFLKPEAKKVVDELWIDVLRKVNPPRRFLFIFAVAIISSFVLMVLEVNAGTGVIQGWFLLPFIAFAG